MFVFRKIWRTLFCWNTRFEIRPFALLPIRCQISTTKLFLQNAPPYTLRKKWLYSELLWSAYSRIRTDTLYLSVFSPYAGKLDQDNSEYGHFSPSDMLIKFLKTTPIYQSPNIYSVLLTIMPDQFAAVVKVQRQSPDDFSSKKLLWKVSQNSVEKTCVGAFL